MNKIKIIDSTTISSFIKEHYPTHNPELDTRPIDEILEEIHRKLKKYV